MLKPLKNRWLVCLQRKKETRFTHPAVHLLLLLFLFPRSRSARPSTSRTSLLARRKRFSTKRKRKNKITLHFLHDKWWRVRSVVRVLIYMMCNNHHSNSLFFQTSHSITVLLSFETFFLFLLFTFREEKTETQWNYCADKVKNSAWIWHTRSMGRGEKAKPFCAKSLCFDEFFPEHQSILEEEGKREKHPTEYRKSMHERKKDEQKTPENNITDGQIGMQIKSNTNKLHRINENLLT